MNNKRKRRVSLLFKVALSAIASVAVLSAILVYFYGQQMSRASDESLDKRARAITMGLASECEYGLSVGNRTLLQEATTKVLQNADVVAAIVFDDKGEIMASTGKVDLGQMSHAGPGLVKKYIREGVEEYGGPGENESYDQFYRPVLLQSSSLQSELGTDELSASSTRTEAQRIGLVRLTVSVVSTEMAVQKARRMALGITGVTALLVSVLYMLAVRRTVRPLLTLASGTERLAEGDLTVRVKVNSSDEIGELADSFNKMAQSLQSSRDEILDHQRNLEQRVEERTGALKQANDQLQHELGERARAEQALRDSEVQYRALFENASEAVWLMTDTFLDCNQRACEMWACQPEDIIGHSPSEFSPPTQPDGRSSAEAAKERIGAAFAGQPQLFYWKHLRKDGSLIDTEISLTGITLGNKRLVLAIGRDITERKRAEANLEQMHRQLLEISRSAGMAEVATSVLHNVGNVLNSVNVSTSLLSEKVQKSKVENLAKAMSMMQEHANDLPAFLTQDPKGKQLPGYLIGLSQHLMDQKAEFANELHSLASNVEHIKEIVAMQQSYAKVSGIVESVSVADLVEDALRMNSAALARHQVRVVREYISHTSIRVDKHKALQILVNLVRNAKYALDDADPTEKLLTLRVEDNGDHAVRISVIDNGIGIEPKNLQRIFEHGFTTRKEGHGLGLHIGALAAKEMGGGLSVFSGGLGKGAVFELILPFSAKEISQ